MTTKEKIARRKLSLLELATDMNNVSKACKIMGYSRQQFYEIRRNFQTFGPEGLVERLPGAKGRIRTGYRRRSSGRCSITRWNIPATARCGWSRN
jgi:molybdenum-dependent DNA-binding transcriptional regulator ModE